ncbi:MAG: zinc-dependent alcohol dehydrogenase family protein [Phycisphaerales bacterium]|nr:MAG: zinc-dependent alcohol dehydrogenase family protein [Phycisphaerales bacterium]
MKAMVLDAVSRVEDEPLKLQTLPVPKPGPRQIRVKVAVCGVCHTELDEIEGRLRSALPIILGHEIVGTVDSLGAGAAKFKPGDRVGIAWINSACGACGFCTSGHENLCPEFRGTGCHAHAGYAEYTVVPEDFAYAIPETFSDAHAAPLLCAGAIGYRALRPTGVRDGQVLGLFGFGASAHIVIQIVRHKLPRSRIYVFTRPGQKDHQDLARELGADWVGATGDTPPRSVHCAIDFTPVWTPIVEALGILEKGGRVVVNAIRKEVKDRESLLRLDYSTHLWQEKELKSVANITRRDAEEFLPLAAEIPIIPKVQEFGLENANDALTLLKRGKIHGAAVLRVSP